jgi:hypothetical protein
MNDTGTKTRTEDIDVVDALRHVAMLVRVRTRAPGELRIDRRTTREVEQNKNAETGTVSTQVKRFKAAKEWDGAIRRHQKEAGLIVKHYSTPWGEDEARCLPNENFMDCARDFDKHAKEVERLTEEIESRADELAELCNRALGDLEVEPVTGNTFRNAYALEIEFHEIPQGSYKGMPKQVREWLQLKYRAQIEERFNEGLMLGLKRLAEPLQHLVERIDVFEKRDAKTKGNKDTFKDSVTTNVKEVVEILSSFNLLKDPKIQDFINGLVVFRHVDAKMLRNDDQLRAGVRAKAQETIDRLSRMMGPIQNPGSKP